MVFRDYRFHHPHRYQPAYPEAPVGQGPLANERLHLMEDGSVVLEFKRPWKDGTHREQPEEGRG